VTTWACASRRSDGPRVHFAGPRAVASGGHPPKLEPEVIEQIRSLEGEFAFETYMSLTCHNCPDVVQALNLMACSTRIRHVAIDGDSSRTKSKRARSWRCR